MAPTSNKKKNLSWHQLQTRKTKDWASRIIKDLIDFKITLSMDEIENTPSEAWKELIKVQTCKNALKHLNTNIGSKSRNYTEIKMSNFYVLMTIFQ